MLDDLVDGIVRRKTIIDGDPEDTGIINCGNQTEMFNAASSPAAVNICENEWVVSIAGARCPTALSSRRKL